MRTDDGRRERSHAATTSKPRARPPVALPPRRRLTRTVDASHLTLDLPDTAATDRLGRALAGRLGAGDVVGLEGPVGAGKTHLARAAIRAAQAAAGTPPEDVPSPTYTLVQTYRAGNLEIWHADLYRLSAPDEAWELGLEEAFDTALCLIEWPDRMGGLPGGALTVALEASVGGTARRARLSGPARIVDGLETAWGGGGLMGEREAEIRAFLRDAGMAEAARRPLAGDASARRYERVDDLVLMDCAEPGTVAAWLEVGDRLSAAGLSVPRIEAADAGRGLVLLEDLGDGALSRVSAARPALEAGLYAAAADVLGPLGAVSPDGLPDHGGRLADGVRIACEWYAPEAAGAADNLVAATAAALDALPGLRVLIHRDYHADNLFWLPARRGVARMGLIDFQDAGSGPWGYDLASLLRDVRRDVSDAACKAAMARMDRPDHPDAERAVAACGAVRGLRILGVFARLAARDGKAGYLGWLPRTWALLQGDLAHPALADLRAVVRDALPAPTPERLEAMRAPAAPGLLAATA